MTDSLLSEAGMIRSLSFDYPFKPGNIITSPVLTNALVSGQLANAMLSGNDGDLELPDPNIWPGTYLRLEPLNMEALPYHSSFVKSEPQTASNGQEASVTENHAQSQSQGNRPDLREFLLAVIAEAKAIGKDRISGWMHKTVKKSSGVDTVIEIYETRVFANDIKKLNAKFARNDVRDWSRYPSTNEAWFARESFHDDVHKPGTATWQEFIAGIRDNHSENEADYTPDIYDARLVLDYATELKNAGLTDEIQGLTMRIFEMAHAIKVANNRVFATLVITGSISGTAFIVAQLPIDLQGYPGAHYSNNQHRGKDSRPAASRSESTSTSLPTSKESSQPVTIGAYTSIEYLEYMTSDRANEIRRDTEQGTRATTEDTSGRAPAQASTPMQTRWVMATASDAKGMIPQFVQQLAIPGTIAKDVKFFIDWCEAARKKKK